MGCRYFIGADTDWAATEPAYKNIILTSIEKRFDVSVLQAVQAMVHGTFTGGLHIGTLETGEVAISPFYNLDWLISAKIKADLEQIKVDMIIPGKSRPSHSKQFFDPKGGGAAEYLIPWKACNSGRYKRRIP